MKKKVTIEYTNHFLFCPGPVNVHHSVKEAVVNSEIGHREPEFSQLLSSLCAKTLKVFEVKKTNAYQAVFITGSGTAANESVLSTVVGNQHILVISNGEFGERLAGISKMHNKYTHHQKHNWGEKIDLVKVEKLLQKGKISVMAVVHHETSTGMLNPVADLGKLAKKYKVLFIVDTVSSAGAEKIDIEKWNISFCTSSSGKALGSFPGLGIVIGKKTEFKKLETVTPKTTYLHLYNFYKYAEHHLQTPNTPGVQLFFALEQALSVILDMGINNRRNHIYKMNQHLRMGLKKLGFTFLLNEKDMSSVLTTVHLPKDIHIDHLKRKLREKSIIIYNGKGPLLNKVFQVGSIGSLDKKSIVYFLLSFKEILDGFRSDIIQTKTIKSTTMPLSADYPQLSLPKRQLLQKNIVH